MSRTGAGRPPLAPSLPCPRVSVIIPHFNMPGPLARCLASVKAQRLDGPVEIIVVDNGSTIGPGAALADHPDVILLQEPTPGPGPARNAGIAAARAEVLAFIDADCRADAGWLAAAVAAVEARGRKGLVGGEVRIDMADPARLSGTEAYEAVFGFRQRLYIEKMGFSATCNMAMHRAIHAEVGPFAGIDVAEDKDWGQRATAAGHRFAYQPAMRVLHPARPDAAALRRKWQRHIAHEWTQESGHGRLPLAWVAKALAMPMSLLVDGPRLLAAPHLGGLANRWRGLAMLAHIRLFRMAEMLRQIGAPAHGASQAWQARA